MPTHFEVTYGDSLVLVDEPLLLRCTISQLWLVAAVALLVGALVVFAIRPKTWQLGVVLPCGLIVAPLAAFVGVSSVRNAVPHDGNVFHVVSAIQFPRSELALLVGLAVAALTIAVFCLVVKRTIPLRIVSAVIATLSIAPLMQSVIVGRAINRAVADLDQVHTVPVIGTKTWPKSVHVGKPFAVDYELTPAIPVVTHNWVEALLNNRHVDPKDWTTVSHCTASQPGMVSVTLAVTRGPVRVERRRDVMAMRDEGPKWMPLEVGNTWELAHVSGRDLKVGELDKAFAANKADAHESHRVFRVESDAVDDGLHTFVVSLVDERGKREERTVHRGDGILMDRDGNEIGQMGFLLLGGCRFTEAPVDEARSLAGPTVCGAKTSQRPYRDLNGVDTFFAVITLGALDTRPTHPYEEGYIVVRSGRS